MQLTASKPAVYAWSVYHESVSCVACTEGSRQLILCLVRRRNRETIDHFSIVPARGSFVSDAWLLTFAIGGRQVKRFTLAYLELPRGAREVPMDTEYLPPVPVYGVSRCFICALLRYEPLHVLVGGRGGGRHSDSPLVRSAQPAFSAARLAVVSVDASNQAMQLTASKSAVYAWSVCRRERLLRGMHRGLAAADLVTR